MLAGHIVIFFLLGLIFMLGHPAVALVSVPFAMGIYLLELFVAFVQAYVFTMLSALFIGMGVAMGHHGEHDHGAADAATRARGRRPQPRPRRRAPHLEISGCGPSESTCRARRRG